jgi:transcriptional regulator with PAS, ATPase and Fis domain
MTGAIEDMKKLKLQHALRKLKGNRTHAARELGVSVRTIRTWIDKFDLKKQFPSGSGSKSVLPRLKPI